MLDSIRDALSEPWLLGAWLVLVAVALGVLVWDLRFRNPEIGGLMKVVWVLTVAYSGILGLGIYYYAGRKQISRDDVWRKGFRSVAHCYSGCGLGEILGVILTLGLLSFAQLGVTIVTFLLAYVIGLALTIGPLVHDGMEWESAVRDAVKAETASIVVMEAVAITVGLVLGGQTKIHHILFWSSLVVSLTLGLLAAYPVNVLLIQRGVKEGMHDPRQMAAHAH